MLHRKAPLMTQPPHPLVGQPLPPLNIHRWWHGKSPAHLWEGRVTVIDFWATWCTLCVRAIPKMNRLYAACQRHDVEFVAICATTGAENLEDVHMLRPIEYPCAIDVRKECEQALQVKVMPAFFVVDADGIIQAGGLPSSRVEPALKEVLGLPEDYDLHGDD